MAKPNSKTASIRANGDKPEVDFLCIIAPIQTAIKIGDGMRVQFDIAETQMGNAIGLIGMREKVLRVRVTVEDR
jgi:hypothetical protein